MVRPRRLRYRPPGSVCAVHGSTCALGGGSAYTSESCVLAGEPDTELEAVLRFAMASQVARETGTSTEAALRQYDRSAERRAAVRAGMSCEELEASHLAMLADMDAINDAGVEHRG